MPLTGEAKTAYQREYMRKKRAGLKTRKPYNQRKPYTRKPKIEHCYCEECGTLIAEGIGVGQWDYCEAHKSPESREYETHKRGAAR
jgi:hypothetical protein